MKNIYIHIPFCIKKCFYCDFSVYAIGNSSNNYNFYKNKLQLDYIDYWVKEIEYKNLYTNNKNNLETIYFGGGTPSLLDENSLEKIFNTLNKYYKINNDTEITMECEPNTLDKHKLEFYKKNNINRISLGLQTYNNELLKKINRNHTKEDFIKTYNLIREYDFKNINIDLIIGIPGDNLNNFRNSILKLLELNPNHISLYYFTLELKSYFGRQYKNGNLKLVENYLDYFKILDEYLQKYDQYEISNLCQNNYYSRHNLMYWKGDQDYLAFGVSSVYLEEGYRISNPKSITKYYKYINSNFDKTYLDIVNERGNIKEYLKTKFICNWRVKNGIYFGEIKLIFEKFKNPKYEFFISELKNYVKGIDYDLYLLGDLNLSLTKYGFLRNNDILLDIFNIIDSL